MMADFIKEYEAALFWARLGMVGPVIIAPAILHFSFIFPTGKITRKIGAIIWGIPLLTLLYIPTKYNIESIVFKEWGLDYTPGQLFVLYGLVFVFYFGAAVIHFLTKFKESSPLEKVQLNYLILSFSLTALISSIVALILPLAGNSRFAFLGPVSTLIFLSFVSYTIIRHRLMDIRVVVRLIILRSVIVFSLIVIGFILTYLFNKYFVGLNIYYLAVVITLVLGVIYPVVERYTTNLVNLALFRQTISKRELVSKFGELISKSIKLDELESSVIDYLNTYIKPMFVDFVLNMDKYPYLWERFKTNPELLVYDEIIREIQINSTSSEVGEKENIARILKEAETAVAIPLVTSAGVIGFVVLGEKKDGDAYNSDDLETLESIMYQAGIAVENASLFEEVQQFNKKLQTEVTTATQDLKVRNKRLTILRQLDQIILNTLNINEMAQKIVDLVSWEMGLIGASLLLLEEEKGAKYLRVGAVSATPLLERGLKTLDKPLHDYRVAWGEDPSNAFYKAITERRPFYTTTFRDMYVPPLTIDQCDALQAITKIEHNVVYALSAKGRALGAISFGIHVPYDQLTQDDKDLIEAFIDEAGIAIDSARLYTELERSNKDLVNANERLQELDKMKDELVSVASHELRTPMTAIKSYLWMALYKQTDHLTPHLKQYLERAYISSERMIDLVNDILSASRLEGGRVELDMQPRDPLPIIHDVADQLKAKVAERHLTLKIEKPKKDLPLVLIDENRFREILFNIIGNSVKYTDKGSIEVSLSTHAAASKSNGVGKTHKPTHLWITVTDTGRGMAESDIPRLFNKFSKLEQGSFTKTAETGGTGLGLYITKGLVELHGGKVWVESKGVGKGSAFTFSVRIA